MKRKAQLKASSEAKKAAKKEKKVRQKAPSAFALQEAAEQHAAVERHAEEQKAAELASRLAAAEEEEEVSAIERQQSMVAEGEQGTPNEGREPALSQEVELRAAAGPIEVAELMGAAELRAAAELREAADLAVALEASLQLHAAHGQASSSRDGEPSTASASEDTELCVVCEEQPRTHLVVPCGHRCLCKVCGCLTQCTPPTHAHCHCSVHHCDGAALFALQACSERITDTCPICRGPKLMICEVFL